EHRKAGAASQSPLSAQFIQHLAHRLQPLVKRKPPIDRLVFKFRSAEVPIEPLDPQEHRSESQSINDPEIEFGHGLYSGFKGSKWLGGKSTPDAFSAFKKFGRIPVARKLPMILPLSSTASFTNL